MKNAIMFPGQGSQYVGMGKSLYESLPQAKDVFASIDDHLGYKLSQKCFSAATEELKDTATQQLAILAVSIAAYEALKSKHISFDYVSGLSLGEYSCLYAAGVLNLADVVTLVRERALAMQRAASLIPSTMFAVIGVTPEKLNVHTHPGRFFIANINSPQQVVISLRSDDREHVKNTLSSVALRVVELPVSGGFHCPFMESAKEHLSKVIDSMKLSKACIPVMSNVTAQPHSEPLQIRDNLLQQLVKPVLWNECVQHMRSQGVGHFYEVGPSKVLRGLMRKIDSGATVINIENREDVEKLQEAKA